MTQKHNIESFTAKQPPNGRRHCRCLFRVARAPISANHRHRLVRSIFALHHHGNYAFCAHHLQHQCTTDDSTICVGRGNDRVGQGDGRHVPGRIALKRVDNVDKLILSSDKIMSESSQQRLKGVLAAGLRRYAPQSFAEIAQLLRNTSKGRKVEIYTLETPTAKYIFVGEDHYTQPDKKPLADVIRQLASSKKVQLHLESQSGSTASAAYSVLLDESGISEYEDADHSASNNSLLVYLGDLVPEAATPFYARPEDLDGSFVVSPPILSGLVYLSGLCADLQKTRAEATLSHQANLAENILKNTFMLAERLVSIGTIDEQLMPVIKEFVTLSLRSLKLGVDRQASRPLVYSFRDSLLRGRFAGVFLNAVADSVFAPHVVSDAVFATQLRRTGQLALPTVIVCGDAHARMLKRMLSI